MQSTSRASPGPETPESSFEDEERYTACSRANSLSLAYAPGSPSSTPADDSLQNWRDHVQEMPFIPDPRPRTLTPLGFRDDELVDGAQKPAKPLALYQSSPWFKVPPNIRRDILRLAFGDRRVHMSLAYRRYYDRGSEGTKTIGEWWWFSCVCSRPMLPGQILAPATDEVGNLGPWTDNCKSGNSVRQKVGAIGWLLSCRQNYAEGIDVLYSTNAIIMTGQAMISHIAKLLLPQRLASMTSIEVRWPLLPEPPSKFGTVADSVFDDFIQLLPDSLDLDEISIILDILSPAQFPSLRKLCISFEKLEQWYDSSLSTVYESILQRLRFFVKARPKPLVECIFAFPEDFYGRITSSGLNGIASQPFSQVWDDLDGNLHMTRIPFRDSYPKPPFHLEKGQGVGFWIVKTHDRSTSINSPSWSPVSADWDSYSP
ncbi:hypothetical protein FVEN_g804 [Fusarium venenatum]|uniref:DUF7730 domain-containing protein n=1 Tax=Fusarium venenatum TaxID=56646 RepID=A0A2L2TIB2_9HYPO|nr:uncharacterized protein FVRRES_10789 [Fusarium venenatum]KAG8361363.1 hypothetical protein FVEN_g804 [Fusarium venenatum]KAH6967366.1 hypothetical protein EDB82DRAFT_518404 [Fusarium venenatum]CEI70712.1 unnamed protein product [Fusarium venenatum]